MEHKGVQNQAFFWEYSEAAELGPAKDFQTRLEIFSLNILSVLWILHVDNL